MSKAIVEIEIPQNCWDCKLCYSYITGCTCVILDEPCDTYENKKHTNCPLKEV
jgi:hypothetical protein